MRSNYKKLTSRFLAIFFSAVLCIAAISCSETETTDSTKFAIYYAGITDIGPSMNFTLDGPSYIGAAPSDFAIIGATCNGETCGTESFAIDGNTGALTISNTASLPVGLYAISVSCRSNGHYYEFKNAISINLMKKIPDGITVEPNKLIVDYGDIINPESSNELPTAQVKTDGNHISINKYIIANVYKDGKKVANDHLFTISGSGQIAIVKKDSGLKPGIYALDLKLTTAVVNEDSEEGIFERALEVDVTSKPLALNYTPASGKAEQNAAYSSLAPSLTGSTEGLIYSIKSVTPENAPVSIDPSSGIISLAESNGLSVGTVCSISVNAQNAYGSTDFDNVYNISIIDFIEPITEFTYEPVMEVIQGVAFEQPVKTIKGDEVLYSLVDLDSKLSELNIEKSTGKIYATQGNSIPKGEYTVTVLAKNTKSEQTASFTLKIVDNPYYFTFVHWGNNLSLNPMRNYASQYRVTSDKELAALQIAVKESDITTEEVAWNIEKTSIEQKEGEAPYVSIDNKGTLSFTEKAWKDCKVMVVIIKVTAGKGKIGETSMKVPVFIDCSKAKNGVTVQYTPFVFQVNPEKGGVSVAPTINGTDKGTFLMDYRRKFGYYNINGPKEHVDGEPGKKSSFMYSVWESYYKGALGQSTVNTGARAPLSYYDNTNRLSAPLGYVEPDDHAVKINAQKWTNSYGSANGVMIGQMTFVTDGQSKNLGSSPNQIFPIAIWFDTKF